MIRSALSWGGARAVSAACQRRRIACSLVALALGVQVGCLRAEVLEVKAGVRLVELVCPTVHRTPKGPARAPGTLELVPPEPETLTDLSLDGIETPTAEPPLAGRVLAPALAIALWGDSHAAARFLSDALLEAIGYADDDARSSFIPASLGIPGVRLPVRRSCSDKGWTHQQANAARNGRMPFARGLMTMSSSTSGSYVWIDFGLVPSGQELASLALLFRPGEPDDRAILALSVDEGPERIIVLDEHPDGVVTIQPDRPIRMVKFRLVAGTVAFEGVEPHYANPGRVTIDTFGIPGARFRVWRGVDETYLRARAASRRYDLILLEYGTNEGSDASFDAGAYEVELRAGLDVFRAVYPDTACVLIGPTDRGVLVRRTKPGRKGITRVPPADLLKFSRVHQAISSVQQRVGRGYGCGFWNWQEAMGGPGGAYRWFHARPGLMARDLIHLNPAGYRVSARKLAQFLERDYPALR